MAWFETVAEAQRRARKRLPGPVYKALVAGAERGTTLDDNVEAFNELGFVPRVASGGTTERQLATTVMGQAISLPVITSPVGVQAVHPAAEVAVARATAGLGTAMGLSSFASKPLDQVVAANPDVFFQIYWLGDRDRILQVLDHARNSGAKGIIVTLDWSFVHRRDWGSPFIPERLDLSSMLRLAPSTIIRPKWLSEFLRHGGLPELRLPNLSRPGGEAPTFFGAYGEWIQTPQPTWEDIEWLRKSWGGPFMVKGIMHVDDARKSVEIGADAISVSNHGGNNLDGTPASIRALAPIVDAVGDQIEVLLDGGIRRGSDVAKALALGARAVLIGRAYLWGLGADGENGVRNVLEILRNGIDETLLGMGRSSIHDLTRDDLVISEAFARQWPWQSQ